jgi:DNA-binding GntR family transcriptional regulator
MLSSAEEESMTALGAVPLKSIDDFEGTLSSRVYLALRDAILRLGYRPGQILRKQQICEVLKVSRSPVSEAVARLASEGLVTIMPQAGTFVARLSIDEIRESAFMREALEVAAVEFLAPVITKEQILLLRRNLRVQEALVEDGDVAGFYEKDAEMHLLLLSFTGFRRLPKMAGTVWLQVSRARHLISPEPSRLAATLAEHCNIVDALETGNARRARKEMRDHLRQLLKYLEPLVESRPDLFS